MKVSHKGTKARRDKEEFSRIVVECAYRMHVEIGPGLLESVYEAVLDKLLQEKGLKVRRQQTIPIEVMGLSINEGFRADLIVEDLLLVELKSIEKFAPVHSKQVLTYLRLLNLPLGLLLNFGAATFKEGCKRIVNGQQDFVSSCLRVNQREVTE
jgi:GxxExxY protein